MPIMPFCLAFETEKSTTNVCRFRKVHSFDVWAVKRLLGAIRGLGKPPGDSPVQHSQ